MRTLRRFAPVLLAVALMLALCAVAQAAPTTTDVTARSCSFGQGWFDGLSRIFFGLGFVLAIIVVIMALRNIHAEGPWGAIVGLAGLGVLFFIMALIPVLAPIALAASGAPACP